VLIRYFISQWEAALVLGQYAIDDTGFSLMLVVRLVKSNGRH